MLLKVEPKFVKKNKAVYLSKDLPTGRGFGNTILIKSASKGYMVSDGFINGQLKVQFPLHQGTENLEFNVLSAGEFLECDPYQ